MYKKAQKVQNKREQLIAQYKEEKEEKELAECTFQPKIYTRDEDLDKLKDESFYEGVPRGFKVEP